MVLFGALTILAGVVLVEGIFTAGTPIAFEPETGTLASGAAATSVGGQSGSGAIKFKAVAPTPTPTSLAKVKMWPIGDSITEGQNALTAAGYSVDIEDVTTNDTRR